MSVHREIPLSLDTDQATVVRDIARDAIASTDPAPEFVDTRTGEIHGGPISGPTPATTTGMDGNQYQKPAPSDDLRVLRLERVQHHQRKLTRVPQQRLTP